VNSSNSWKGRAIWTERAVKYLYSPQNHNDKVVCHRI